MKWEVPSRCRWVLRSGLLLSEGEYGHFLDFEHPGCVQGRGEPAEPDDS